MDEAEFARLKALDENAAAREEGEVFKRHLLNFPGYAMPEIERPVVKPRDIDR